jgi:hypothetical protein
MECSYIYVCEVRKSGSECRTSNICHQYIARQREEIGLSLLEITPIDICYLLKVNAEVNGRMNLY